MVPGLTAREARQIALPASAMGRGPMLAAASRLAEKLQAITELDLEELQIIDPPRGYGRD
jgi:hypothetical protein